MAANDPSTVTHLFEIDDSTWKTVSDGRVIEIALERHANGRLTEACRANVIARLRQLPGVASSSQPRAALCAIGARGATLRRMSLPPSRPEDRDNVLALQIEREFPIAPVHLAWGHQALGSVAGGGSDILVAAVRNELVEDYAGLAKECGLNTTFTLGILAINAVAMRSDGNAALIHLGKADAEIALLENGLPLLIRTLPWGVSHIRTDLLDRLGADDQKAESIMSAILNGEPPAHEHATVAGEVVRVGAEKLTEALRRNSAIRQIRLAGELAGIYGLEGRLRHLLGDSCQLERINGGSNSRPLTALAALQRLRDADRLDRLLLLRPGGETTAGEKATSPFPYRWLAIAAALILGLFVVRYAVPVLKKPALEKKLEDVRAARAALPPIDREVDFLRSVQKSQPAYLNALAILADATPRGTKVDSINLNQRGEFTFVATMQGAQQANELRTKLINSGIFSNAVIEEQTPAPDHRQASVRIRARWDPSPEKKSPVLDRIAANANTNAPSKGGKS